MESKDSDFSLGFDGIQISELLIQEELIQSQMELQKVKKDINEVSRQKK